MCFQKMYGLLWFLERTSTYLMLKHARKNRPIKFSPEEDKLSFSYQRNVGEVGSCSRYKISEQLFV